MRSFTTRHFRQLFRELPEPVQASARRAYRLFRQHPAHPGLNFKQVDEQDNIYTVRIGLNYRALGQLQAGEIVWFWIGTHSEYDKML